MLIFGHVGFTLGATLLLNTLLLDRRRVIGQEIDGKAEDHPRVHVLNKLSARLWTIIKRTKGWDLRFVIIGSLLPDIIDKPIGHYFFRHTFDSGYLYCHTLLFILALALIGFFSNIIYKKNQVLLLAFGSFTHLILDFMWRNPRVFLWPLFGFTFERGTSLSFGQWLWSLITTFLKAPWVAIPELMGFIVTVWFFWLLWQHRKVRVFILSGKV